MAENTKGTSTAEMLAANLKAAEDAKVAAEAEKLAQAELEKKREQDRLIAEQERVNAEKNKPFTQAEKIPCLWCITPAAKGSIYARHTDTAREFEGTLADFNKFLRGI